MQDIITPTSYQSSVPESPKKHKTVIVVVAVFLVLVVAVILISKFGRKSPPTPSPLEQLQQLEQVSVPVSLTPEQQIDQMRKLETVGGESSSSSVPERIEMLKKLQ